MLSIGLTLESNAIKYLSGATGDATKKEVKGFYQFLADWEKQHLEALRTLYNSVRTDFFATCGPSRFQLRATRAAGRAYQVLATAFNRTTRLHLKSGLRGAQACLIM